jgi:uncharacterized protein YuzE
MPAQAGIHAPGYPESVPLRAIQHPDADAARLRLTDGKAIDSERVNPHVVFDDDNKNRGIGIERLHVKPQRPDADPTHLEAVRAA